MVKCYIKAGKRFWEQKSDAKIHGYYKDVYEWFVRDVFYPRLSNEEWQEKKKGELFGITDYKEFLEDYFKIKFKD